MPTYAAASDLVGQLDAQGLPADATNRGRDTVAMSRSMADLAAIFVDMDIQVPGIREVLYELRTNPTTGEVPIAILAGDGRLEAAERLAAEHQRVVAVPRPHSSEVVASTVKQLADLAAVDPAADKERAAQAAQAGAWLAKLESGNRPFYTFRRTACWKLLRHAAIYPRIHRGNEPERLPYRHTRRAADGHHRLEPRDDGRVPPDTASRSQSRLRLALRRNRHR